MCIFVRNGQLYNICIVTVMSRTSNYAFQLLCISMLDAV